MSKKYIVFALVMGLTLALSAVSFGAETLEGPVLLTSAGQSPDAVMAKVLMRKASIDANYNQIATAADLEGYKTVIIVIGASSKGLGAAGINFEDELKRVQELMNAAEENGVAILAMHLGGSARRGESSNQLIEAIVPHATSVIVVEDGNKDGLFNTLISDGSALRIIPRIADAVSPLQEVFGK